MGQLVYGTDLTTMRWRFNIIIYVNNNIISLEMVVFCAIDDETTLTENLQV